MVGIHVGELYLYHQLDLRIEREEKEGGRERRRGGVGEKAINTALLSVHFFSFFSHEPCISPPAL